MYRYTYLRDENRFPVACVAMLFDKSKKEVAIGVSIVHPRDRKAYSKDRARDIARKRAEIRPIILEDIDTVSLIPGVVSTHDILAAVYDYIENGVDLETGKKFPLRVRNVATAWFVKVDAKQTADQANEVLTAKANGKINMGYDGYNPLLDYSSDLVPSFLNYNASSKGF